MYKNTLVLCEMKMLYRQIDGETKKFLFWIGNNFLAFL